VLNQPQHQELASRFPQQRLRLTNNDNNSELWLMMTALTEAHKKSAASQTDQHAILPPLLLANSPEKGVAV
jgi:hypothetical protein